MPLTVATLQAEIREFDFPYAGDSVHVSYRPGLITPEGDSLAYADWLAKVLAGWDLVGLDGDTVSLEAETIRTLPDSFLQALCADILRNSRLDPTTSATSGDG